MVRARPFRGTFLQPELPLGARPAVDDGERRVDVLDVDDVEDDPALSAALRTLEHPG